jgi:anti-sigma regulatory factor (Ser/Thr protein kinase)
MTDSVLILDRTVDAPCTARQHVRALAVERTDDATLLVSELVTNAVVHGTGTEPSLTVDQVANGVIHVAVRDNSRHLPERHPEVPDTEQVGGRGLFLIESFATAWGWEPLRSGKRVWFEIACASPAGG